MFRRKEDSMFDNNEENSTQGNASGSSESGSTASSSGSSSSAPVSAGPASSPVSSFSSPAGTFQPGASARPVMPEAPRSAVPTASAFRPGAAPHADVLRSRGGEPAKSTSSSSMTMSGLSDKSGKGNRRVLTVGHDILLKGEIATCDRLVIEGKVDATLNDVHTVEIAETGSFKGSAQIEDAEISGLFEGDLIVKNRLVIYSTGKVRGTISYGEIEIERGGELTGEIKSAGSTSSLRISTKSAEKAKADAAA